MERPPRPTGVSIIAILDLISGTLFFLLGVFVVAVSGTSTTFNQVYGSYPGYASISGYGVVLGGFLAVGGLLAIFVGYGIWTGKDWAWTLAVVLYALGLVFSLFAVAIGTYSGLVGLIVEALFLWYLWRPNVRSYFGRRRSAPILDRLLKGDF
jgi:lysylphosphatidylglycerol synthetase-like protein (DUF2156 family)